MNTCLDELTGFGATRLKAEFEAEGATSEEVSLLASIAAGSSLGLVIKIGGCEAVRDMREALAVGAEGVVAPMIESPFAVEKFAGAATREATALGVKRPELAINIESVTGARALGEILLTPAMEFVDRVVVGRTDLTHSMGLGQEHVGDAVVASTVRSIVEQAKSKGLHTTVGGTVTPATVRFVASSNGLIDTIETRKVVLPATDLATLGSAIKAAVRFELAWLNFKAQELGPLSVGEKERQLSLVKRLAR